MDQHCPSFPNPGNIRFPSFFPPPLPRHNQHRHHLPSPTPPLHHFPHQSPILLPPPNSFHLHHGHSSHQFVNPPHHVRHQQPLDPYLINHHHRNYNHNLNNRPFDFPQAPRRVTVRLVEVDRCRTRPCLPFRGYDGDHGGSTVWDPPPRVSIDATPPPPPITGRIPRACFDPEHPPYRPIFQPVDRFRNDQDGGSRIRKDGNSGIWFRADELPKERRYDFSRNVSFHHDQFQRDFDRGIHRKEFVSATVEQFSGSFTQEELIMQGRGAPYSPTELRIRAIDGGNGFYEKDNHVLESERYGDRDIWEQKKKSVFLRIQPAKPSCRNNCERSPSLSKDREPSQFPDHTLNKDEVSAYRDDTDSNELDDKDDLLLPRNVVEKVSLKPDSDNHCETKYKTSKSPNGKALDKTHVASGSCKECSPSFRKKREITNPHSSLSSLQVLRKGLESISVDNLVNSQSSESTFDDGLKDSTAAVKVTESTEIALTAPHMKSTAVGSSKAVDGKCDDDDYVSAGASVPKNKRRKIIKPRPFSSGQLSGKPSSSNEKKKQTRIKNEVNLASSKAHSSRHSSFLPSSGRRHTTVIKSRTWHRTDSPASNLLPRQKNSSIRFVIEQMQNVSQTVRAQSNSYVRKGNSLLRNPGTDDAKNTPCEIPEKMASPCNIDSSNCNLVADSSVTTENGPQGLPEDMPKSSGNSDFEMSRCLEDQGSLNHSNQAASVTRRMVYVKPKSNQLVAAPNSSSEITSSKEDIPDLMSDVYYKRKRNQLVRATPETCSKNTISDPVDKGRRVSRSYVRTSATKRDPNRVSLKIPRSWKLCNTGSPKKGVYSLRCQQVLPHLLPWKRATYRRSLFHTSADLFKNDSPLSHKLLSSRKTHIEAKSVVAALEKEQREKSSFSVISSGIENKHNPLHEEHSRTGNDEYVCIGKGNQLIRNPKRRTRILANEKVRWSLHTARMRLAKKSKYCQFFTRFGKCNKKERKCSYIHDPSKIVVCTKFVNGFCSDPKCKLTHKIIPERMPDCTFFLHGLCSNESCPYRHVSVNPKAAICESFLEGYCAEGNECLKKHSYMCPLYEATGECFEGFKCKLYHPEKGKDKKRKKNTKDLKNARGRYYISLGVSDEEEGEQPSDDPDELIKPVRLLQIMSQAA